MGGEGGFGVALCSWTPFLGFLRRFVSKIRQEPVNTASPEREENKPKVTIRGYANSLGSSYLLLYWLLCWLLELGDAERDTLILHDQKQTLHPQPALRIFPHPKSFLANASLSHLAFFSTGHQATLATIQWRVAFLTSPVLSYPYHPSFPAQLLRSANSPTTPPHRSIRAMELYTPPAERKENVYSTTHLGCPTNNDAL
ncbi:uncharacterized protein UHOD_12187 [Ustilago sp. UG-2017b]|nr:uncharacterized protein UHOD_12187 [Ustilago sp. UG-2017b]